MVASACKLVKNPDADFDDEVISAFGEAFNNVVLHGQGKYEGDLEIEVEPGEQCLTIRLLDYGNATFDLDSVPLPDLDSLPEHGLGIFIIRSFMDDVTFSPGTPNVLSMTKHLKNHKSKP